MEGHFSAEQASGMGMGFPIVVDLVRGSRGDVELVPSFAAESTGGDLRSWGANTSKTVSPVGIRTNHFPLSAVTVSICFTPFKCCVIASCPDQPGFLESEKQQILQFQLFAFAVAIQGCGVKTADPGILGGLQGLLDLLLADGLNKFAQGDASQAKWGDVGACVTNLPLC